MKIRLDTYLQLLDNDRGTSKNIIKELQILPVGGRVMGGTADNQRNVTYKYVY